MKMSVFILFLFISFLRLQGNPLPATEKTMEIIDSIIDSLNLKARNAYKNGDFDESKELLEEVLNLKLKYYPHEKRNLANTYVNLSVAYGNAWDFDNAITMGLNANELYFAVDSSNITIGSVFFYLSFLSRNIGDYEKASEYYKYSINFYEKLITNK